MAIHATKGGLYYDSNASHCLIRVEPTGADWLTTHGEIMSNHIAERVFERILKITQAQFSEKLTNHLANISQQGKYLTPSDCLGPGNQLEYCINWPVNQTSRRCQSIRHQQSPINPCQYASSLHQTAKQTDLQTTKSWDDWTFRDPYNNQQGSQIFRNY